MICKTCGEERDPKDMQTIDKCWACVKREAVKERGKKIVPEALQEQQAEARKAFGKHAQEFVNHVMVHIHFALGGDFVGFDDPEAIGQMCNALLNATLDVTHGRYQEVAAVAGLALIIDAMAKEKARREPVEAKDAPAPEGG